MSPQRIEHIQEGKDSLSNPLENTTLFCSSAQNLGDDTFRRLDSSCVSLE